jgi:two-component system cell cycle sensor histidine kinase/response regulator CckA
MSATQILVVEDERLVATAIQNELQQFGYEVSGIASSAREAVEKAIEHKPDLVLMDIHLKGEVDGIEAARKIHSYCGVPIVYLSAFSDSETVARAGETYAFGYLLKPYEERELHTTIEMAIAKHRVEQKLEETERWLAAIHNGINDAVIAVDAEHRVRLMNPASESLTDWWKDRAVGLPVTAVCNLTVGNQLLPLGELINLVSRENRSEDLPADCRIVSRKGRTTPVEGTLSAIFDARGDFLGIVLALRDISVRLEFESLQRQIEERSRRQQKLETVSRLADGLSQNLNSLLTAILGNTSLALAVTSRQSESRELLERVEAASQRAAELVQRLQMFSFAGRPAGMVQPLSLCDLVTNCLKEVGTRFDSEVSYACHCDPHLWPVAADELLLGQAIVELALNAQDAMPQGGQVRVELENIDIHHQQLPDHPEGAPGQFVRLRITDTGHGMKPAVRARISEPGFTTKDEGRAAGLGLALVFAVVEQHRGWIECSSHTDRGTRFDLYFPRHGTESSADGAYAIVDKPHGAATAILLADADPMVRDVGRRILEKQGYRVLLAQDGLEAVAVYRREKEQIDLAILDLNMPRLTPYAVLERMLEIDPHARAIFSGGYFAEDLTACNGHVLGVITKPYRQNELVEMVQRALAARTENSK